MKHVSKILIVCITTSFILSCSKDEEPKPLVNEEGLTEGIVNFVSQDIIDEMKELGMPIYGGSAPPEVNFEMTIDPLILKGTNIEDDNIGTQFLPVVISFENQNSDNLTIESYRISGGTVGEGFGGYIVGENNKFTVFLESMLYRNNNQDSASVAEVYSGTINDDIVINAHYSIFMIDNYGNANNWWIENGEGRVFEDGDGETPIKTGELGRAIQYNGNNLKNRAQK